MTTTTPTTALADLDLDKLAQQATMFRDIEAFHPGHFRTLKIFASSTLDLIAVARRSAQPVAPVQENSKREGFEAAAKALQEKAAGHKRDGEYELYEECLECVSMLHDLKPAATPSPQIAEVAELSKAEIDAIVYQCRQQGNDTTYDIVNAAIAASRRAAPASAGQVKSGIQKRAWSKEAEMMESWAKLDAGQAAPDGSWLWCKLMDWCKNRGVAPSNYDDLFAIAGEAHKLFVKPAEGAGQASLDKERQRDSTEAAKSAGQAGQVAKPELTVWYGPMPESNGKSNFTAILMRKGGDQWDNMTDGITIDRSEYPDRVRYEADRVRYLLGELAERPFILDYDADKHSGYVAPTERAAAPAELNAAAQGGVDDSWKVVIGAAAALAQCHIENDDEREAMMEHVRKIITAIPKLDGAPK